MSISEQLYRQLLGQHDWFYAYSDDHSVWSAGKSHMARILDLQKHLDADFSIWDEYAPAECKRNKKEAA
jgi:hypothetical protein